MVGQYDHRAKGYRSGRGRAADWEPLDFDDRTKSIQPQWRIVAVPAKAADRVRRYRVGFCDVASPTNERTLVAALIPPGTICGHKVPTFTYPDGYEWAYAVWLACELVCMRLHRAEESLSRRWRSASWTVCRFLVHQPDDATARRLVPLVARLTCTSPEMIGYWQLLCARWVRESDRQRRYPRRVRRGPRLEIRAELDAIVAANVYGIDRDELEFILSTFPTAARYETTRYGEFRSAPPGARAYDAITSARARRRPCRPDAAETPTGLCGLRKPLRSRPRLALPAMSVILAKRALPKSLGGAPPPEVAAALAQLPNSFGQLGLAERRSESEHQGPEGTAGPVPVARW